jgi:indole-3-glycerol phosphate synthase
MTILDKIVAFKRHEIEDRKNIFNYASLEKSIHFPGKPVSLKKAILTEGSSGIIAEFKRKSPSAGVINETAIPHEVCLNYMNAGSSAVSVLTDNEFFGGSSSDLCDVRANVSCPVLRKDFIIDEYQVIEAKSLGADAILLIAEILDTGRLDQLYTLAVSLGMEVLLEIHDEKSIGSIPAETEIIGINSRDLRSFSVSHDNMVRLIDLLPGNLVKVAESGIRSTVDFLNLRNAGFNGFLIGEHFMRNSDPGLACKTFIDRLRQYSENHNK